MTGTVKDSTGERSVDTQLERVALDNSIVGVITNALALRAGSGAGTGTGGQQGGAASTSGTSGISGSGVSGGSAAGGGLAAGGGNDNDAGSGGAPPAAGTGGAGGGPAGGSAGANTGGTASDFPFGRAPVVLTQDAGYCWFQEPRALFVGDTLVVGNVASGWQDASKRGDIESIAYDFASGKTTVTELHDRLELDDHDAPGFALRPDGKLLAIYAKHGSENHFYYRVTSGTSLTAWGAERTFTPTAGTRLTYSNVFLLKAEKNRIYDFYRGLDDSYKPSFAYSDDAGDSWVSGNIVINVPSTQKHRPYVRYATNGTDTIHLLYTEAHPRDYDNSLYHVFYQAGALHRSDGTELHPLTQGLSEPSEGTRVFVVTA